jgi:hypothetical protein
MGQRYFEQGRIMKFRSDIDIDFGNRDSALAVLEGYTAAGIIRDGQLIKHNTGIYVTDVPQDPFTGVASLDHKIAEDRGYLKLDLLNVSLYTQIKSEQHLNDLMAQEPLWDLLQEPDFFTQLIHVGSHYDTLIKMPEPVDSIARMAMFLAVIRPAKRHLIGQPWKTVAETVWDKPADDGYYFKKSHSVAYAHLVVMHMNLICEQISYGFS